MTIPLSSSQESWTRSAYFRAAVNFCVAVTNQIELDSNAMDEELIRQASENNKSRSLLRNQLRRRLGTDDVKNALHEEEEIKKKRDILRCQQRFPLGTLDEHTEGNLRMTLRTRLFENLKALEEGRRHPLDFDNSLPCSPCSFDSPLLSAPSSVVKLEAPQAHLTSSVYFIPFDEKSFPEHEVDKALFAAGERLEPFMSSQETTLHSKNSKENDVLEFELEANRCYDQRRTAFLLLRCESLSSPEIKNNTTSTEAETASTKQQRKQLAAAQSEYSAFKKSSRQRIKKLKEKLLVSKRCPLRKNFASTVARTSNLTSPTLVSSDTEKERIYSKIKLCVTKHSSVNLQWLLWHHETEKNTQSILHPAKPPFYYKYFQTVPLAPDADLPDAKQKELDQYLWPKEMEESIRHYLSGVVKYSHRRKRTKSKEWCPVLLSAADARQILEADINDPERCYAVSRFARFPRVASFPREAHFCWLHIHTRGDYCSSSALLEGAELSKSAL